ncbi:hypothetical protein IFM89_010060, partial [Coptis chinensis]
MKGKSENGVVLDVGANVSMASFAWGLECVHLNLFLRICRGFILIELVVLFEAAVSDGIGNITFHKLVGQLDNSAVSASGAKLAFKSNEEVELQVRSIPLDQVVPESERVLLLKIDVQGWEYQICSFLKLSRRLSFNG